MVNPDDFEEVEIEVAADSGCGDHVAAASDIPGYTVEPSDASRRGCGFIAADGGRIDNEGTACLQLQAGTQRTSAPFSVAKVSRPLMSIGKICDQGHTVTFSKTKAIVRSAAGKIICTFIRDRGLYLLKFRLKAPRPFHGQGVSR